MRLLSIFLLCALAGTASAQTAAPQTGASPVPASTGENPSSRDPRTCLEFPTREQVIACAEKYRSKRPAAKT